MSLPARTHFSFLFLHQTVLVFFLVGFVANVATTGPALSDGLSDQRVFMSESVQIYDRILQGCVVLVELKNGDQYEGVLRTVSSKVGFTKKTHRDSACC